MSHTHVAMPLDLSHCPFPEQVVPRPSGEHELLDASASASAVEFQLMGLCTKYGAHWHVPEPSEG